MSTLTPAQLSASNFSYLRFPLDRWLDDMASLEVGNVELWGVSPHLYAEDATAADVERVRKGVEARGLTLTCFTPEQVMYPINIASSDATVRTRSIRYFEKCADIAQALGSPLLFLTPGWGAIGEDEQDTWSRSADALARIAAYAGDRGVTSVLEALQPVESHTINTAAQIRRMLDEVGSPHLMSAIDTCAMAVAGDTVAGYFDALGDTVRHVHFVDGAPDGHLAWGDGELPLETYLAELAAHDYAGYLSFEIISQRYWLDPLPPVRQSIERITAALAAGRTSPAR